jgi:hypothetical protein
MIPPPADGSASGGQAAMRCLEFDGDESMMEFRSAYGGPRQVVG